MNESPQPSPHSDRRRLVTGAVMGAAAGLLLPSTIKAESPIVTATRKALHPEGAPAADASYSPAILAEGRKLLVISGQGPEDITADMETQIRQTFDRIGILLKAGGATWGDVVIIRSFWVHMLRDLALFRKVRREYLVEPYPASTAVGTTELAIPGLELEIEATAII
jgi:enamine deaminase RidA (YjgF/YER057c/UK114 family)